MTDAVTLALIKKLGGGGGDTPEEKTILINTVSTGDYDASIEYGFDPDDMTTVLYEDAVGGITFNDCVTISYDSPSWKITALTDGVSIVSNGEVIRTLNTGEYYSWHYQYTVAYSVVYKTGKTYIEDIFLNGEKQPVVDGKVALTVITNAVNDLLNYYKKNETYNKTEVDSLITAIKNSRFEAVPTLPTTDIKTNVIYLVPKSPTQTNNVKDEYINLDGTSSGWEKIGDTEIDLSGYVTITALNTALSYYTTTTDLTTLLNDKVDKVTGKGLSTNDYTDAEKQKLANIESNAQVNVQSDWNEDDTEDDGYIKNKPDLSTSLTVTGNPITIESSESNLVECVADVEAVQEGSGDPSPDNIRSIIGQTEVVIEDCGKNLIGDNITVTSNGVNYTYNEKTGSYNVVVTTASGFRQIVLYFTDLLESIKGKQVVFSVNDIINNTSHELYMPIYINNVYVGEISKSSLSKTITVPNDATNFYALFRLVDGSINESFTVNGCQLELGSTATDFEPYKGKTYRVEIGQKNKVEETLSGYTIASTGLITVDSNNTFDMQIAKIKKGETYTITTDDIFCVGYFTEKPANGVYSYDNQRHVDTNQRTFTAPITGYIAFRTNKGYTTPQCEQGSQATPYVPYNPNLPDAIYGGELDVVKGELKVTHEIVDDASTLTWIKNGSYNNIFYAYPSPSNLKIGTAGRIQTICSDYKSVASNDFSTLDQYYDHCISVQKNASTLVIVDSTYSSASDLTSALNGVQVVYELAEPYIIQLTPQQIRLLKGTNHLSCNTGDLSIKYYPDNVLGQLKGDIESEYDERVETLEEKASTPTIKQVEISRNAVSTDGSVMFTALTGHIIVGTSIENDATGNKCVGIPYSMGKVPALKIMNESTMAVLPNITISGILYCIKI